MYHRFTLSESDGDLSCTDWTFMQMDGNVEFLLDNVTVFARATKRHKFRPVREWARTATRRWDSPEAMPKPALPERIRVWAFARIKASVTIEGLSDEGEVRT